MAVKKPKKKPSKKAPEKVAKKTLKKVAKKVAKKTTKKVAKKTPKKSWIKKVQKRIPSRIKTLKPAKRKPSKVSEEERKAALRRFLITKREEIVKEAKTEISKYIRGETKQLVATALDNGDWSVADLSEDISLKRLSTHRETLHKIDEALRKLDEGTYGMCEECGEEISEERMKILPFATYCRDCQEKREQFAELEREARIE